MNMSLKDAIDQEEKVWHETKAQLERDVLELRAKLSVIIDLCASKVKTQALHRKNCQCLNCRDIHAIQQHILALKNV